MNKLKTYVDLARPFTLLPPALGVVSGAVTAWGAHGTRDAVSFATFLPVFWGALMAAVLNSASNAINQIYDLEIDRVNKPKRPLPSGALTMREAWGFTLAGYALAWVLAWLAVPPGLEALRECFWIVLFTSVLVWAYSAPPFRTKARGIWANVTIAVPRGLLLKVAG
jgi:4-hydroxybenzoate polyprenyltransferase